MDGQKQQKGQQNKYVTSPMVTLELVLITLAIETY